MLIITEHYMWQINKNKVFKAVKVQCCMCIAYFGNTSILCSVCLI